MLKKEILKALNEQINTELSAWYHYISLSYYYEGLSLKGFGKFFQKQAEEELEHAEKIKQYILDLGEKVELIEIKKPTQDFKSIREGVESALKAEENNTKCIHSIYEMAKKVGDIRTENFLRWFIEEQIEEEALMIEILDRLMIAGEKGDGVLTLDKQLGKRE